MSTLYLYNFDTVRDNFTKLGRNIKHDRGHAEIKTVAPPAFLAELFPFVIFPIEIVPLYSFDTFRDYFMKLCTNIKHDQTTSRD